MKIIFTFLSTFILITSSMGQFDKVLSMDGTNDFASASLTNTIPNESSFTIEFFFKTCGTGNQSFFDNRGSTAGNGVAILIATNIGPNISVSMRNDLQNDASLSGSPSPGLANQVWYHFAYSHNHADKTNRVYINGIQVVSTVGDVNPTSTNLFLGTVDHNAGVEAMARGYMDELRISSTARYTTTNFTVPTSAFIPDASTLGLWHFEDAYNATAFTDAALTGAVSLTPKNGAHIFYADIDPASATINAGQSIQLLAGSDRATGYSWDPSEGLDNASIKDPIASPTSTKKYTVFVSDTNDCVLLDSVEITVIPLSVISQINSTSFKTYPNPSSGTLTVDFGVFLNETVTAKITDAKGVEVWKQDVSGNNLVIPTKGFNPGIYQLMILSEDESISKTIIIQ